jgi:hypothetical protein
MWNLEHLWSLLGDGRWHAVKDLADIVSILPELVILFLLFLRKYELVEMDMNCESVRVARDFPVIEGVASLE